jgi:acetylornithine deacetylase/succinyl-diaminopimelate desuccinylase-like protein
MRQVIADRAEIHPLNSNSPAKLMTVEGFKSTIVSFNTDIPYFDLGSGKALLYGPGSIMDAHSLHEFVRVDELQQSVGEYVRLMRILLNM